jgi:hypothetical protein
MLKIYGDDAVAIRTCTRVRSHVMSSAQHKIATKQPQVPDDTNNNDNTTTTIKQQQQQQLLGDSMIVTMVRANEYHHNVLYWVSSNEKNGLLPSFLRAFFFLYGFPMASSNCLLLFPSPLQMLSQFPYLD